MLELALTGEIELAVSPRDMGLYTVRFSCSPREHPVAAENKERGQEILSFGENVAATATACTMLR